MTDVICFRGFFVCCMLITRSSGHVTLENKARGYGLLMTWRAVQKKFSKPGKRVENHNYVSVLIKIRKGMNWKLL